MAGAVKPVDEEIARGDGHKGMEPEGELAGVAPEGGEGRRMSVEPEGQAAEEPCRDGREEEVLTDEEGEIGEPAGSEYLLFCARGEEALEGGEDDGEDEEAQGERREGVEQHGLDSGAIAEPGETGIAEAGTAGLPRTARLDREPIEMRRAAEPASLRERPFRGGMGGWLFMGLPVAGSRELGEVAVANG